MASLGNGGRTGNGGSTGLSQKSSKSLKRVKLSTTQERAVLIVLGRLFPLLPTITLSELANIYGADFMRALNSVDSTNGLKKFLHDHCKDWLKQHSEGVRGHVPASWGRIKLVQTGKFRRASSINAHLNQNE